MNPDILNIQNKAIQELIKKFSQKELITFKAPTGSGKTIMITKFMENILSNEDNSIFIVSSLSKSELAEQNFETFQNFSISSNFLKPYLIDSEIPEESQLYIPLDYNVYSLPISLFREKTKLFYQGSFIGFLKEQIKLGKKIYLIKDEAHVGTTRLDSLNLFDKIVNVSATPSNKKFTIDVSLDEIDCLKTELIKNIKIMGDGNISELDGALDKFLDTKNKYNNLLNINPCFIIQISNEEKGSEELKEIIQIIEKKKSNLKWMYLASDPKNYLTNDVAIKIKNKDKKRKWKEYAKDSTSLVDIIISKMVITEGWDIPRACMLFQVRNTKSEVLTEQIIGRVRRNPILRHWLTYKDDKRIRELTTTALIWGKTSTHLNGFCRVKNSKNLKVKTTSLVNIKKIYETNFFNINDYVEKTYNKDLIEYSIFDLAEKWNGLSLDEYNTIWGEIDSFKKWFKFSSLIPKIKLENERMFENYEQTMIVDGENTFASESYFEITNISLEIANWGWEIIDSEKYEYHFDSKSEKEFSRFLKDFQIDTWGKNFYPNSKIKFDYLNVVLKSSYPDFIFKDKNGKIHIFEVKSLNKSNFLTIDKEEYEEKIKKIAKAYKHCSKITNQNFYIPIKRNEKWTILTFIDGVESLKTLEELKEIITS